MSLTKIKQRSLLRGPQVYLCTSEKDFHSYLEMRSIEKHEHKWLSQDAEATTHYVRRKSDSAIECVVCIRPYKKKDKFHAIANVMAHEATHIWQKFAEDVGEDDPATEQEAYAIGNITGRLVEAYLDQA